ncbi:MULTISPECIES: putative B6 ABC transporter permease subunit 1 [Alphaproteobacteria]|uniref:ABC transporter permease n=2 Tax=Alphaproteobacteria TaxID=28211 RepID=A0A512HNR1_9HYPH|nr:MULTISPECIES: ABC transporter permease [Alphaproteobacteria]GEO87095.1 ABC transporter permease [Ciceribacter naphthalenivorans]GLR22632.1 ABC transporter permease [Ciceribacter naphthalenivorans]GLT05488.1 ABC transporter permease [Sphingomonas psychrolutea]
MSLFTESFIITLFLGAISAGTPLFLAGLGEQLSEKAGVLNIGLEGMILAGAYAGFLVAWASGSPALGFVGGAAAGAFIAAFMVLFCVRLGLNQIVIGIALTLAVQGLTALLHFAQFSRSYPRLDGVSKWPIWPLSEIPVLGPILFNHVPVVYLAIAFVALFAWIYRMTHLGSVLQAAGDKPAALDAMGVDVVRTRSLAVLVTGALAGLGGAFMSVAVAGVFIPFMSHGNGFIAIVLAMLARGRPLWVLGGALLFGASLSLATALQVAGVNVPTDVIQMLPFAMVMLVLLVAGRKASLPQALGESFVRGAR